ncbi:tRNA (guanine(46)-N(7))-methyltransferase TrmB [Bartonella ancashensis]|uniref:tRNA (guanine-N(7)-)-methyltransferase n=1 Tax=Bartonella ancashensis TaxID=1318743 RepID=A0A0M4M352_9HYPH|nr:tRNA (guanine(46)-N(7))-methyltransferase TrmB [Bartonella ancashensis]ALE03399.1 tRNA (guanine46-N7-)-methyltransferase [Bartonella ancashensis]
MTVYNAYANTSFFGRRHGKQLRHNQQTLLKTLLPILHINLDEPAPKDLTSLFANKVKEIKLEIGFGGGEHLIHAIEHFPDTGFIGVEPFINGMAKMLTYLKKHEKHQKNLRLYDNDAIHLLDWLPKESLDGIDIFYPDPWPKKKHWKRRFINMQNLSRFAHVLKVGKKLRFVSDIDIYINWTLYYCLQHENFEWKSDSHKDWETPYPLWKSTRYEIKAFREGRTPAYLTFIKK